MLLQEKAIELFDSQLDILSIVKTRFDVSILLRSLLNKEQLYLFKNQHARAFATYDPSNSSHFEPEPVYEHEATMQDLNFVEMPQDADASAKASQEVKSYQIQTDLDRKLLLGIWELDRKAAPVEHEKVSDQRSQSDPPEPDASVSYVSEKRENFIA